MKNLGFAGWCSVQSSDVQGEHKKQVALLFYLLSVFAADETDPALARYVEALALTANPMALANANGCGASTAVVTLWAMSFYGAHNTALWLIGAGRTKIKGLPAVWVAQAIQHMASGDPEQICQAANACRIAARHADALTDKLMLLGTAFHLDGHAPDQRSYGVLVG